MVHKAQQIGLASAEAWRATLKASAVSVCARSMVHAAITSACPGYVLQ